MVKCSRKKSVRFMVPISRRRDYSNLLQSGVSAQLEKLLENDHKEGFDSIPLAHLYQLLCVEVSELWEAMISADNTEIVREAADVANFAHMIILSMKKLKK